MSERNRNLKYSYAIDSYTETCMACGTEYYEDNVAEFYANGRPEKIFVCESCVEDCKLETEMNLDNWELSFSSYDALLNWCKLNHILCFVPANEQIIDKSDIEEFFDALTNYLVWHPDTDFKDYVTHKPGDPGSTMGYGERIFSDAEAEGLNLCMDRCGKILDATEREEHPDVYDLAMKSFQKAGHAPTDGDYMAAAVTSKLREMGLDASHEYQATIHINLEEEKESGRFWVFGTTNGVWDGDYCENDSSFIDTDEGGTQIPETEMDVTKIASGIKAALDRFYKHDKPDTLWPTKRADTKDALFKELIEALEMVVTIDLDHDPESRNLDSETIKEVEDLIDRAKKMK